jgi:hypothetical protein
VFSLLTGKKTGKKAKNRLCEASQTPICGKILQYDEQLKQKAGSNSLRAERGSFRRGTGKF